MYSSKFVAVIRVRGQILRENGSEVKIPFGSEYTIMLKNLESRKVLVNIFIDGQDVLSGNRILLNPNQDMELLGFMSADGKVTHAFKSIHKTQEIVEHRGDGISDGIIRIEYQFEKVVVAEPTYVHWYHQPTYWYGINLDRDDLSSIGDREIRYGSSLTDRTMATCSHSADRTSVEPVTPAADEVITVKGSHVNQDFTSASHGDLEATTHTIIFKLVGITATNKVVEKPVFVKSTNKCTTCGRTWNARIKFCGNCGTALD